MSDLSQFADEIEAATADLVSELAWARFARLIYRELRYRPDQPRAPSGTPDGGRWIDDVTRVAAARCDGFAAGCRNGGTFGSSGQFTIDGKKLCWDCAIKYLGIQDLSPSQKVIILRLFDRT